MSRPPIFASSSSLSGITVETNGSRIVAPSKRADGSIRKELKIRPGFTPEEDIDRYRSTRQLQANARSATKPGIPGLATANVKLTAALAGLSKSQKVREKRKEKNKVELEEIEVFEEEEGVAVVEVRESWESDEEVEKVVEKVVEPEVVEPKKSLKSLIKKLRQAELLKEKADAGQELLEEQRQKIDGIAELEAEIAKLSL